MNALLIAWQEDYHAQAVKARLTDLGVEAEIFDISAFPLKCTLHWSNSGSSTDLDVKFDSGQIIKVNDKTCVWWRRPTSHQTGEIYKHPKLRRFAGTEARHALLGSLMSVTQRFLNDPYRSQRAALKPLQLVAAASAGFQVPKSLV